MAYRAIGSLPDIGITSFLSDWSDSIGAWIHPTSLGEVADGTGPELRQSWRFTGPGGSGPAGAV